MDSEGKLSTSAPAEARKAVFCRTLRQRHGKLRRLWPRFLSAECLEVLGAVGPQVVSFLSGQETTRDWRPAAAFEWMHSAGNIMRGLQGISLAQEFRIRPAEMPPDPFPIAGFKKLPSADRFRALSDRYRCPLNVGTAGERDVAEELLRQLMVPDRAGIEQGAPVEAELVLLKLNLAGIRALMTRDLRFLDALNFYYELPRRWLIRPGANPSLIASWLCIYAQLLRTTDWPICELQ
jgi:hypothetical protein